ncbi:MAG: VanW family protein [Lachnospiraceae bacterium]|nr:VanW family protein [Lachnospiraceae bacterium]
MKIWKKILPFAAFAIIVAGFSLASDMVKAQENEDGVIPDKVYIGDIAVGGMNADEATQAVQADVAQKMSAQFTLTAGERQVTVSAADLGVEWANTHVIEDALTVGKAGNLIERYKAKKDLENADKVFDIQYDVDEQKVKSCLEENAGELNQEPVENGLTRENGAFVLTEGKQGVEVDTTKAVAEIEDFFSSDWNGENGTIELSAKVVDPKVSAEDLKKVKDVLGTFSTDFSASSAGRIANVKNATEKINGTVLYPGEEFSVYDSIGPLDASNGYELAGAYENGTTVESYGGGVCQVSTTLYNAVIRAELEVTERFNHSMMVDYVQPSMDAAIAGTYKNLKFKNSTEAPVYIEGYTNGGILYFTIYGEETRDPDRQVTFESETVSVDEPATQIVASGDPIGSVSVTQKSHTGRTAQLWKIVTVNGVEKSREVFNKSKYNASPKIISVGTASDNGDAINAINAAIATQDEATVRATAAEWSADAIAARQAQADAEAAAAQQATPEQPATPETPEQPDNSGQDDSSKTDASDKKDDSGKEDTDNSKSDDSGDTDQGDDSSAEE